jgi:peroxiredoxin Q/BCP
MRDDMQRFRQAGAKIFVVVKDKAHKMRRYWSKQLLPFAGIPDPEGVLGQLYGQQWRLTRLGRLPAIFVVDRQRRLAHVHYSRSMSDIPEIRTLLQVVQSLTH